MYGTKDHAAIACYINICQAQAPNPQNISPITHSTGVTPVKAKPNPPITRNQAFSLFKTNDVQKSRPKGRHAEAMPKFQIYTKIL